MLVHRFAVPAAAALAYLSITAPAAAQGFDEVEIRAEELGHGLYVLYGAGGNIGLSVGDDATYMIDDQFAPLTDKIIAKIAELTDKPVKFVVNTHWHGDHTGGNENLGRMGAVIIAQDEVRATMAVEQLVKTPGGISRRAPTAEIGLPVITFSRDLTLHLNGLTAQVHFVDGGHSAGDSFIFFPEANVMHTGDLFFSLGYPFIDLYSGGTIDGSLKGLERMLEIADDETIVIPGHGPVAGRAKLEDFYIAAKTTRDRVKAMVDEGKSLAEIQAAKPSAEFDEEWGQWFVPPDFLVETIYGSLAGFEVEQPEE